MIWINALSVVLIGITMSAKPPIDWNDKFVIGAQNMRDLAHLFAKLHRFFNEAIEKLNQDQVDDWSSRHEVNYDLYPHEYYKFKYRESELSIYYHRDKTYSLKAVHLILEHAPYHKNFKGSVYYFVNYYYNFEYLGEAIDKFNEVVAAYCNDKRGVLF